MNRHYLLYPSFFLIFLTGCATGTIQSKPVSTNRTSQQAESFSHNGQHRKAAQLYQKLAKSKPKRHSQFNLLAAKAFLQSGDDDSAKKLINSITPASLSTEQRNLLNLLFAQIHLSDGETEQALNRLKRTQAHSLKGKDKITYYQSLAFAHSLTENQLQSAQARIQLTPLLSTDEARKDNNRVIFNTVNLLSLEILTSKLPVAPDILRGWIALTRIFKIAQSGDASSNIQSDLSDWKQIYPEHPANSGFLESYLEISTQIIDTPSSIALLLPETGRFSQAAQAIKKGFIAAYEQNESDFQPSIRVYDSSTHNISDLYHQAISEGAELVIGPLSKDHIQTLAYDIELKVPVLALNHIPHLVVENLFQFGLSPIDEIEQIASRASHKGVKKILLLTPESNQGHRAANSLIDYWKKISDEPLEYQSYDSKNNDFSPPIKDLLNLNESKDRYNQLKRFLANDIMHTGRIRQDADAIFLSASAKVARSIYPQLRFYGATNIPVYVISQLHTGKANPSLDRDLNRIIFCDIPWLFPKAYSGNLSHDSLRETWQQFPDKYLRLVALGIDSFKLITNINQIAMTPYMGATGKLSLNQENRITRQLACAKFTRGEAILQSPVYEENVPIIEENSLDEDGFFQ